jgi:hypothetical protein
MNDKTHNSIGHKVSAIVDDAIAELLLLGVESRDAAAAMMACQAILRINDNEVAKTVEQFAIDSVWDIDDTKDGGGG